MPRKRPRSTLHELADANESARRVSAFLDAVDLRHADVRTREAILAAKSHAQLTEELTVEAFRAAAEHSVGRPLPWASVPAAPGE